MRIIFHCKDKTGGGDGGQWRGCQQCTLGKDGEKAAVKPVTTLSKPPSLGLYSVLLRQFNRHAAYKWKDSQRRRGGLCGLETAANARNKRTKGLIKEGLGSCAMLCWRDIIIQLTDIRLKIYIASRDSSGVGVCRCPIGWVHRSVHTAMSIPKTSVLLM